MDDDTTVNNSQFKKLIVEQAVIQRLIAYIIGLFIASLGVAFARSSGLGISPMNVLPYVLSIIFENVTFGTLSAAQLWLFILIQIVLLRRDFKWIQLGQFIFAMIFGYFVDLSVWMLGDFTIPTYAGQLVMMTIGIVCISSGLTIYVNTFLMPLPTEGIVLAISHVTKGAFHRVMIATQSSIALITLIISLLFLGGVYGVREGTILFSIFVGKLVPYLSKVIVPALKKFGIHMAGSLRK